MPTRTSRRHDLGSVATSSFTTTLAPTRRWATKHLTLSTEWSPLVPPEAYSQDFATPPRVISFAPAPTRPSQPELLGLLWL